MNGEELYDFMLSFKNRNNPVCNWGVLLESFICDDIVCNHSFSDWIGDTENEVLRLSWNENNEEFSTIFTEQGFLDAKIDGEDIFIEDKEGIRCVINLVFIKNNENPPIKRNPPINFDFIHEMKNYKRHCYMCNDLATHKVNGIYTDKHGKPIEFFAYLCPNHVQTVVQYQNAEFVIVKMEF